MIIGTAHIKLHAPWVRSLKEKRMVVKSIIEKVKHRFNVSIAEIDAMDIHQTIMIGLCCVSNSSQLADSIITNVVNYIENHTEATIEDVQIDIL